MNNITPQNKKLFGQIYQWISAKKSILLLTHQRADGDAFGAIFAMHHCLRDGGVSAVPYVTDNIPERYESFAPKDTLVGKPIDFNDFDGVMSLDCANKKRIDIPNNTAFADLPLPCCNIDHHIDNSKYGEINCIEDKCSATTEILSIMIKQLSLPCSSECATELLLGMITDTGGYRFNNTTSQTLEMASWLMEKGGDHDRIVAEMYYSESINMLKFQAKLFDEIYFAFDNRLAYFLITNNLLDHYGVAAEDVEDVVDIARAIKGVEIICRIQETEDGMRFSFRSMNPDIPIIEMAHQLGGGGHAMAAGALQKNITIERAEELLLAYASECIPHN